MSSEYKASQNGRKFIFVIRETAEGTKTRIVYDASAHPNDKSPSLNECLEPSPALQNQLWSVLVRNRFHPIALSGDLKQAFLQVCIREADRDVLRFHWLKDLTTREVETLRFTRALFGLSTSPFLLGGVTAYPEEVEEIRRSLYVDDLISGGKTVAETENLKKSCVTIFGTARFELHKWHSNDPALETETNQVEATDPSYVEDQLGVKPGDTTLLGVPWDKENDTIKVNFPDRSKEVTKRGVLGKIAKIYGPLGIVSPTTLQGKLIYREACDSRIPWDRELPPELFAKWTLWEQSLPNKVEIPRSLVKYQEEIKAIDLHAFSDASRSGVSSVVYAVTEQPSRTNQGIVASKSRLAKKGLTISRLELVAGHMSTNLLHNVKESLSGFPVRNTFSWLDSTVALYWIRGSGEYKQFVNHRVRKIQEKDYIKWRYVSSAENPADIGSQGGKVDESSELSLKGPPWLTNENDWPADIVTDPSVESQAEAKVIKEILATAVQPEQDDLNNLWKWDFWKAVRITTWIARFGKICQTKEKITGPLTTDEINAQLEFWIKRAQDQNRETKNFKEDKLQLNLQINERDIYECRGRVQGDYPIYVPDEGILAEKLVHMHTQRLFMGEFH